MARREYNFNLDWSFCKKQEEWEQVTLPHTWNGEDFPDKKHCYFGEGCYRKQFNFAEMDCAGKNVFIEFGAANTIAEVYVNEVFVGKHEGGYSVFRFDITEFVKLKGENSIAVKVNNAPTDYIAPINNQGDFTKMGGLYRDVKLIVTEEVHIDLLDYGSAGIYITPQKVSEERAEANILVKLANEDTRERAVTVTADIFDAQGNFVTACSKKTTLSPKEQGAVYLAVFLANPVFWNGRKNPHLYRARITVQEDDRELDVCEQSFGIRTYHIDTQSGFFLNGEYLDLRGGLPLQKALKKMQSSSSSSSSARITIIHRWLCGEFPTSFIRCRMKFITYIANCTSWQIWKTGPA